MSWNSSTIEEARRKAEDKFTKAKKRDARLVKEQSKSQQALDDKVARLKALRLAKEAADKQAAAQEAVVKKPRATRKKAAVQD